MKRIKIFSFFLLCLIISSGLTGCYLPLIKKEVTVPLFEKDETTVLQTALAKYQNAKIIEFSAKSSLEIESKGQDLSFINKNNFSQLYSFLDRYSPNVLGIDNSGLMPETKSSPAAIPQKITIDYDVDVQGDLSDPNNVKTKLQAKITVKMEGMSFDLAFDVVGIANDAYIRLTTIPEPLTAFLDQSGIEFKNVWWKLSQKDIDDIGDDLALSDDDSKKIQEALNKEEKLNENLKKALSQCHNLNFKSRERDTVINDKKHYNYLMEIDKKGFEKCAFSIMDVLDINKVEEDQADEFEGFGKTIDNALEALKENWINLQINKKTLEPKRFDSLFIFESDNASIGSQAEKATVKLKVNGEIKSLGQAVYIEAPQNAKSMKEEIGKQLEDARSKARDAKRISDAKQMAVITSLYLMENDKCPENIETINRENYSPFSYPAPSDASVCPLDASYRYHSDGKKCFIDFCLEGQAGSTQAGWNYIDEEGIILTLSDQDNDGLSDEEEKKYGSDPNKPDTDNDGYNDGSEVRNGYNPNGSGKLK
jgi:hypothetical protein